MMPPISKRANRAANRRDTTISRLPAVNQRPAVNSTWGRSSIPRGVTPRIRVLASPDPSRRGALMISTTSAEITGSPRSLRAISSKYCRMRNWFRVIRLPDSACEPLRTTMMLRGSPVLAPLASIPRARARSNTKTATTRAMPRTVATVERQRTVTLRRLYFNGRAIGSVECFEAGNHTHSRHSNGRRDAGDDAQQRGHDAAGGHDAGRDLEINQETFGERLEVGERPEGPGPANSDDRAERRQAKAFRQNEAEQFPPPESQRLEYRQFSKSFADGHAHRAHRDQHQGEDDDRADRADQHLHVTPHADEAHLERPLGLRPHLG